MVMVRAVSLRRAGTAVTGLAEVVGDLGADALSATDRSCRRGDIVDAPVAERAMRSVGVVDHQREALRPRWRIAPMQRRRLVGAVARVLNGNRLQVGEGLAGQAESC